MLRLCELKHHWLEELDVKETNCLLLLELLADVLYVMLGSTLLYLYCLHDVLTKMVSLLQISALHATEKVHRIIFHILLCHSAKCLQGMWY